MVDGWAERLMNGKKPMSIWIDEREAGKERERVGEKEENLS